MLPVGDTVGMIVSVQVEGGVQSKQEESERRKKEDEPWQDHIVKALRDRTPLLSLLRCGGCRKECQREHSAVEETVVVRAIIFAMSPGSTFGTTS